MADLERLRPDDRRGVEQLYRRAVGIEASERLRLRWEWEHRRNPQAMTEPAVWVAREGRTLVAAASTLPVCVSVSGKDSPGVWLSDPVVATERQMQGLQEQLVRAIDRASGVILAADLSAASTELLQRLRWPAPVTLPCVVKPLSRRALRNPDWPVPINRLVSAVTLPFVRVVARARPLKETVEVVRRLDSGIAELWAMAAPALGLAVRRDPSYLNWKFVEPPHVRYSVAVLRRGDAVAGYTVYRHTREPRGRVTHIVDFLVAPGDERGLKTLLRWVDREARAEDSDKIRCHVLNKAYRRVFKRSGYFSVRSTLAVHVKINAPAVPPRFHEDTAAWHFTAGDGEIDH